MDACQLVGEFCFTLLNNVKPFMMHLFAYSGGPAHNLELLQPHEISEEMADKVGSSRCDILLNRPADQHAKDLILSDAKRSKLTLNRRRKMSFVSSSVLKNSIKSARNRFEARLFPMTLKKLPLG